MVKITVEFKSKSNLFRNEFFYTNKSTKKANSLTYNLKIVQCIVHSNYKKAKIIIIN